MAIGKREKRGGVMVRNQGAAVSSPPILRSLRRLENRPVNPALHRKLETYAYQFVGDYNKSLRELNAQRPTLNGQRSVAEEKKRIF
jgi:hypothetical protein